MSDPQKVWVVSSSFGAEGVFTTLAVAEEHREWLLTLAPYSGVAVWVEGQPVRSEAGAQ